MISQTEKIRLDLTHTDHLSEIIRIEKSNAEFVGLYDVNQHKAIIEGDDTMHLSVLKTDNSFAGYIILAGLTNPNNSIEFRRIVMSEKGKGYGRDALKLTVKYCFEDLKAHRIWLDVFEDNIRAIGLYKSQGFSIEGILRDSVKQNDKYRSLYLMSILRTDYRSFEGKIIYDGKRFIPVSNSDNGEVTPDTVFIYRQIGNIVTCQYSGSKILSGHLMGLVNNDGVINMSYHQVNREGKLMTGLCVSKPEVMNNGKIRLREKWRWTSGDLSDGESVLEEI
jgi:diamine N-acetyltransferase